MKLDAQHGHRESADHQQDRHVWLAAGFGVGWNHDGFEQGKEVEAEEHIVNEGREKYHGIREAAFEMRGRWSLGRRRTACRNGRGHLAKCWLAVPKSAGAMNEAPEHTLVCLA